MKARLALGLCTVAAGVLTVTLATSVEQHSSRLGVGNCAAYSGVPAAEGETAGMVLVRGGSFRMGSESHQPEERFVHDARVDAFWIDRHEVTNAQFRQFVDATGYVTQTERGPEAGSAVFIQPRDRKRGRLMRWWQYVEGATWREPAGPGSSIAGKDNHPVVNIAYEDALAYARWRGRSLPTEAQWEFAARGGRDGENDWSSAFDADGKPIANTWQGAFPVLDTKEDGYAGTAPVGCFKPNGYGLYDMIGNVWEWTGDTYRSGHFSEAAPRPGSRVIKGGSHLCAANFCSRYRPAARQPQEVDLSAAHLGFRTVLNISPEGRKP